MVDDASSANTRRVRDEAEVIQGRLTDLKFDSKKFRDPLKPRQTSHAQFYPQGVTAAMEERWLALIKASASK
ncbi:unnamed protein product [Clonostachys solani]|uniref:Uncharacterized protein n=1 Tax=Clonostachys solani TaxID=160281 RepID=A0A9N9Z6A5_9HYPO|nr:unnamed protein product [Clonostachys solani]